MRWRASRSKFFRTKLLQHILQFGTGRALSKCEKEADAWRMKVSCQNFGPQLMEYASTARNKGGSMKKIFALVVLSVCMAVPSFAGDVVGHSVKVAGKDSAKVAAVAAKDTAKAVAHVGKFLF